MKIIFLCNEYPPHIYGGAGVHVEHLSRELAHLEEGKNLLTVLCFGNQREHTQNMIVEGIGSHPALPTSDPRHQKLLDALYRNVVMAGSIKEADLVHCHTWYTHFAGCVLKQMLDIPLVLTTHSLEPHRSWKAEQLGSAYKVSSWLEKTAYQNADGVIAVSQSMREDVHTLYALPLEKIRVIYNGIDTHFYTPTFNKDILASYGIDPHQPFLLFVGRVTRQKGIIHLVNALPHLHSGIQVVLCTGAPDTEAISQEMKEKVAQARAHTTNEIIWIPQMVPRNHLVVLYSHASLFVCPSVYEPFGIINLEAMACSTPVVASAVGGIREAVIHNQTGLLVPFKPLTKESFEPKDPAQFSKDLAHAINQLLSSPERINAMGTEARKRVEQHFSWKYIARQTLEYYKELMENRAAERKGHS